MSNLHINVSQSESMIEYNVPPVLINKLYKLVNRENNGEMIFDNNTNMVGTINTGYTYEEYINIIKSRFNQLHINAEGYYILFKDEVVKQICVDNFSIDGIGVTQRDINKVNTFYINKVNIFRGNTEIESFEEISNFTSLIEINDEAFNGCTNLKHIDLSNIQILGKSCFDSTALEGDIYMPRLQKAIGSFYGTNITSVSNLGSIMNIQASKWTGAEHGLFENCTLLKSIKLPETVTILDNKAFCRCTSLETINFPLSITTLNQECLAYLTAIKDTLAYFPNVRSVGNFVFGGSNYQYVYLNNLEEPSTDGYYWNYVYHRGLFMTSRGDKTYKLIYLKKIKNLPAGTFGRCQINYVIINNETPPELLIDNNNSNAFTASTVSFIVVPDTAVQTYREDTSWSPYSDKIIGLSIMTKVATREQFDENLNNGDSTIYLIEEYM